MTGSLPPSVRFSSAEFFKSLLLSFSPNLDEFNPDIPEWRQDVGRVIKKSLLQVSDFHFLCPFQPQLPPPHLLQLFLCFFFFLTSCFKFLPSNFHFIPDLALHRMWAFCCTPEYQKEKPRPPSDTSSDRREGFPSTKTPSCFKFKKSLPVDNFHKILKFTMFCLPKRRCQVAFVYKLPLCTCDCTYVLIDQN